MQALGQTFPQPTFISVPSTGFAQVPQGPGVLATTTGGVTAGPRFTPGGFAGATASSTGVFGVDRGQLQVSFQHQFHKSATVRGAGSVVATIDKHQLFFVHRPLTSVHVPNNVQTAASLSDLNYIMYMDAVRARSRQTADSVYHRYSAFDGALMTCDSAFERWNLMGVCSAAEGADESARALHRTLMISDVVGGWVKCVNYWGVRNVDAHLWLVWKLMEAPPQELAQAGHLTDTSFAAWAAREQKYSESAPYVSDRADYKRRRMEESHKPGSMSDPVMCWQLVPFVDVLGEGPDPSHFTGYFKTADSEGGDEEKTVTWYGAPIYVGRTGFVDHQGARPHVNDQQFAAASEYTHPLSCSTEDLVQRARPASMIGTIDLYMSM